MDIKVFDIETRQLDDTDRVMQFLQPFDESEVKTGNLKDPIKIQAKIDEERQKHEAKLFQKTALHAETASVWAIMVAKRKDGEIVKVTKIAETEDKETDLLNWFWSITGNSNSVWLGLNIADFDIPFMAMRSMVLGVPVPKGTFNMWKGRISLGDHFVDLMDLWSLTRWKTEARRSHRHISQFLGLDVKDDIGKDLWKVWNEDRAKAEAYMDTDITNNLIMAEKLGALVW